MIFFSIFNENEMYFGIWGKKKENDYKKKKLYKVFCVCFVYFASSSILTSYQEQKIFFSHIELCQVPDLWAKE